MALSVPLFREWWSLLSDPLLTDVDAPRHSHVLPRACGWTAIPQGQHGGVARDPSMLRWSRGVLRAHHLLREHLLQRDSRLGPRLHGRVFHQPLAVVGGARRAQRQRNHGRVHLFRGPRAPPQREHQRHGRRAVAPRDRAHDCVAPGVRHHLQGHRVQRPRRLLHEHLSVRRPDGDGHSRRDAAGRRRGLAVLPRSRLEQACGRVGVVQSREPGVLFTRRGLGHAHHVRELQPKRPQFPENHLARANHQRRDVLLRWFCGESLRPFRCKE